MKKENIEEVARILGKRGILYNIIECSEYYKDGYFEFVLNSGRSQNRIMFPHSPELKSKILDLIREEINNLESKLEEM